MLVDHAPNALQRGSRRLEIGALPMKIHLPMRERPTSEDRRRAGRASTCRPIISRVCRAASPRPDEVQDLQPLRSGASVAQLVTQDGEELVLAPIGGAQICATSSAAARAACPAGRWRSSA
jgi:hypothetical protein